MPKFTRRHFAALAAGAPLAGFLNVATASAGGHAAASAALYDVPVGRYRMTALLDGIAGLPRGFFISDDMDALNAELDAIAVTGDTVPAPVTAYLLQSDDRTILIDAGMGGIEILGPGFGRMASALAAMGVAPADVDTVLLTHAHPDHLGGLVGAGGPVFPSAEVIVGEVEHGFWSDAGMRAQAPEESRGLFDLATGVFEAYGDRLTLVGDGAEVAPGITFMLSPGHTPGHGLYMIDGGDRQLLMVADTLHSVDLHMANPDIGFGFDVDSPLAAQSRRRVLDMVTADKMLIAGSHVHFPGFGRVRTLGDGFRFAPATWS